MTTTVIDSRLKLQLLLWYGAMSLALLLLSVFLASDFYFISLIVAGTLWLTTIPYHAQLSLRVAMATFGSAFVVPFLGSARPYVWEMAALLAWTGVPVLIFTRNLPADLGETLRRNKWIFIGAALYCIVLLVTMKARGVGLRILGSSKMGGRFYFQQLICAIFPLLFAICPMKEKSFVRLFVLQCVLACTYILSDFAFARGGPGSGYILTFLEVPGDAVNFEHQAENFGIRRFQSFSQAGQGLIFALLAFNNLRDFIGRRSVWLIPSTLLILGITLYSGHRIAFVSIAITVGVFAFAQKFLRPRNLVVGGVMLGMLVMFTYAFSERLPESGQRALSFLPGLHVESQVALDANSTMVTRKEMLRLGWGLIPQYFWIGRGFANAAYGEDFSAYGFDKTIAWHLAIGRFYNGFIGLMVNTGVFGFLSMTIFIIGGLLLAFRIIRHVRRYGSYDRFSRIGALVASSYVFSVIAFFFLHGDSEFAMKSFSLLTGMLIMVERLFDQRLRNEEQETAVETNGSAAIT